MTKMNFELVLKIRRRSLIRILIESIFMRHMYNVKNYLHLFTTITSRIGVGLDSKAVDASSVVGSECFDLESALRYCVCTFLYQLMYFLFIIFTSFLKILSCIIMFYFYQRQYCNLLQNDKIKYISLPIQYHRNASVRRSK